MTWISSSRVLWLVTLTKCFIIQTMLSLFKHSIIVHNFKEVKRFFESAMNFLESIWL